MLLNTLPHTHQSQGAAARYVISYEPPPPQEFGRCDREKEGNVMVGGWNNAIRMTSIVLFLLVLFHLKFDFCLTELCMFCKHINGQARFA